AGNPTADSAASPAPSRNLLRTRPIQSLKDGPCHANPAYQGPFQPSTIPTLRCTSPVLSLIRPCSKNNTNNWEYSRFRLTKPKTQASFTATSVSSRIPAHFHR